MTITEIEYGSLASSKILNDNFYALNKDIQDLAANLSTTNANLSTNIATLNKNFLSQFEQMAAILENFPVGLPLPSLDGILPSKCIWLEGAEVSRETYSILFEKYGTKFGVGDGSTTFNLPDFTNRTLWGSDESGYIEAGMPNITGSFLNNDYSSASGAHYNLNSWSVPASSGIAGHPGSHAGTYYTIGFDASKSNAIFGKSDTVQPPGVKARFYTRYE